MHFPHATVISLSQVFLLKLNINGYFPVEFGTLERQAVIGLKHCIVITDIRHASVYVEY